jgi:hypothetical protein
MAAPKEGPTRDPRGNYLVEAVCTECEAEYKVFRTSKPKATEAPKYCPACRPSKTGFYTKRGFIKGHTPRPSQK